MKSSHHYNLEKYQYFFQVNEPISAREIIVIIRLECTCLLKSIQLNKSDPGISVVYCKAKSLLERKIVTRNSCHLSTQYSLLNVSDLNSRMHFLPIHAVSLIYTRFPTDHASVTKV